jgi:YidC/Oxa1 family membrane protein insertase
MDERRLLMAVALSFVALTSFRLLYPPAPAPKIAPAAPASSSSPQPEATPTAVPAIGASPSPAATIAVQPVAADHEQRVEVAGPAVEVAFSNKGARVLSWRLRHYADRRGHPEELVTAGGSGLHPLDLQTGDISLDARLREALFVPSAEAVTIPAEGTAEIHFSFAQGDIAVDKLVRFDRGGYLADVRASVRRDGRDVPTRVAWGPGIGNPTSEEMAVQGYQAPHAVVLAGGSVQQFDVTKLATPQTPQQVRWAGIQSQYFAALWIVPSGGRVELTRVALPPGPDGKEQFGPVTAVQPGTDADPLRLYVGPKDYDTLARLAPGLERVVPVGDWIGPIVVLLMGLLRKVHSYVGNYGWSIVVLTILINLVMAPLRHYSIANSLRMAKIAPEMRVIQERYRKLPMLDPKRQQMNDEIAALYARHGMNMSSQMTVGCLPILITMPFLIAFYRVLTVSIDLRGAPFLWMSDLSQRDPLYLTPILMGLSMFVMQRMMPSTADPAQQKIMLMMPLFLTVFLLAGPGGLNLYWLASNLCSITQQTITLRLLRRADNAKSRRR